MNFFFCFPQSLQPFQSIFMTSLALVQHQVAGGVDLRSVSKFSSVRSSFSLSAKAIYDAVAFKQFSYL